MTNRQKGAVSGIALILIVIIIIAVAGIGYWWYRSATTVDDANTQAAAITATTTGYSYVIGTTTIPVADSNAAKPQTRTVTYTTYERRPVASTGSRTSYSSATQYHNGTYGLTLRFPSTFSGYRSYETYGGPNGLPGTLQIHFVAPGENTDAFVVNVFSKEQWNIIRTQENYVHLNTSNIGEGTYLGENFTWIYSATIYSHAAEAQSALSGAVFY